MPKPYLEPACEFFDRTSVPKEIVDIRNNDQQRNLDYFIKRE